MVSSELISTLRELSRADKFSVVQVLISELAREEVDLIKPDRSYSVWSPYDGGEAEDPMLGVLEATRTRNNA